MKLTSRTKKLLLLSAVVLVVVFLTGCRVPMDENNHVIIQLAHRTLCAEGQEYRDGTEIVQMMVYRRDPQRSHGCYERRPVERGQRQKLRRKEQTSTANRPSDTRIDRPSSRDTMRIRDLFMVPPNGTKGALLPQRAQ